MAIIPFQLRAVPAVVVTFLFTALSLVKGYELSSILTVQLLLILHPLYYWGVFRPSLFPAWLAFLIGFAIDIRVGNLLGLNAFLLVFIMMMVAKQQRYLRSQPFATQWTGFTLICLAAELIRWAILSALNVVPFPIMSALVSGVCNAALYPVTTLVMGLALKLISGPARFEKLQ